MMANKLDIQDHNPGIELLKNKRLNTAKESLNNRNRAPETKISVILRILSPDLEWSRGEAGMAGAWSHTTSNHSSWKSLK